MGNLSDLNFDADEHKEDSFKPIPAGQYKAVVESSSIKPTRAGTGDILGLHVRIIAGEFKRRLVFDNLNIKNISADCQDIGQKKLGALCRAVGIRKPADTCELHDEPIWVHLEVVPHWNKLGQFENKITTYSQIPPEALKEADKLADDIDEDMPF